MLCIDFYKLFDDVFCTLKINWKDIKKYNDNNDKSVMINYQYSNKCSVIFTIVITKFQTVYFN